VELPKLNIYGQGVEGHDAEGASVCRVGRLCEFPVHAPSYTTASDMAFTYVLQVLKLKDFELRIVGA
jgi:hypothetical protein